MRAIVATAALCLLSGCAQLQEHARQEERVSDQAIDALLVGKATRDETRKALGEPRSVRALPRQKLESWEYRYRAYGTSGPRMVLYAQFSADGVLREALRLDEMQEYGNADSGSGF
jgi:outer membrane protein assembly factor BamE (lipoprotein component of BamABCDE complex)